MNIDQGANADWLRARSWDVRTPDGNLVKTPEQLLEAIQPMSLDHFLTLPAAEAMPEGLRNLLKPR